MTSFAKEAKTQLKCFQLFMTDDLIEYTATCPSKKFIQSQKNILRKHMLNP